VTVTQQAETVARHAPNCVPLRRTVTQFRMPRGEPFARIPLRIDPDDLAAAEEAAGRGATDRSTVLRRWITLGRVAEGAGWHPGAPEWRHSAARRPQEAPAAPQAPRRAPASVQPAHPVQIDADLHRKLQKPGKR
jgi:hypothetical protein